MMSDAVEIKRYGGRAEPRRVKDVQDDQGYESDQKDQGC